MKPRETRSEKRGLNKRAKLIEHNRLSQPKDVTTNEITSHS